jgi:hypothetical protein
MSASFETIMEKNISEINFFSASGSNVRPGSILESLDKDIEWGYLPNYMKNYPPFADKTFETRESPYNILLKKISGEVELDAAVNFMKIVGLKFDARKKYKIEFAITDIISKGFKEDLTPMDFELALNHLKKSNKKLYRKAQGHFLVFKVLYAKEYRVNIEGSAKFKKTENSILVSQNNSVPFGVIGYKIKPNRLKEVD